MRDLGTPKGDERAKEGGAGLSQFQAETRWKWVKEEACSQEHKQVLLEPRGVRT